ncbi:hypothetical protein AB4865_07340 [Capnocytophaga sp. ARDL2]|uniref:hypothetical protein n=1 Tax=Capnocytophaga sp. ARDL2 TaxID=3238809 RepID=UPI003557D8A9
MKTFEQVKQIAKENKDGFTISLIGSEIPKKGFVVALKETQNCFNDKGLKKVIEVASKTTNLVGGWLDKSENKFYYDAVMIVEDLENAKKLGKENKQLAIFNLETETEIRL